MRYLLALIAVVGISSRGSAEGILAALDSSCLTIDTNTLGQAFWVDNELGSTAIDTSEPSGLPPEEHPADCPMPVILGDVQEANGGSMGASTCGTTSGSLELPTGGLVAIVGQKEPRSSIRGSYISTETGLFIPSPHITALFRPPRLSR